MSTPDLLHYHLIAAPQTLAYKTVARSHTHILNRIIMDDGRHTTPLLRKKVGGLISYGYLLSDRKKLKG